VAGAQRPRRRTRGESSTLVRRADGADSADETSRDLGDDESPATRLIRFFHTEGHALFRTSDGSGYASVHFDGRQEALKIQSPAFKQWLAGLYYAKTKQGLGQEAVNAAVAALNAEAVHGTPGTQEVHVRVASAAGAIYLDLGNEDGDVVEVTKGGWRLVKSPPVHFRRPKGLKSLPKPERGGSVEELFSIFEVPSASDRRLLIAWMLACLRPTGPYPVLELQGEQGSGKSTLMRLIRDVVDPGAAPVRSAPHSERDLSLAAYNNRCVAFDNLSALPQWLSDAICRMSTGGAHATRENYSDLDEIIVDVQGPVMMTGIERLTASADLLDRTISIELPNIPDHKRRRESEMRAKFEKARPRILGALLTGTVAALRNQSRSKRENLTRMADFESWVSGAGVGLGWPDGTFQSDYRENRQRAHQRVIDADPVARGLCDLVAKQPFAGTASALLEALSSMELAEADRLPKDAAALGGRLRRLSPALRGRGVHVEFDRKGHKGERLIHARSDSVHRERRRPGSTPARRQHRQRRQHGAPGEAVKGVES